MNWDDLRFVLALGRTGTLAGAARELRVDHTTVGRRILAVEESLATRLFDRTPDGFVATDAGDLVLARAKEIEQQVLTAERECSGLDGAPTGTVRVTALDSIFDRFIVPRLGPFAERYPGLSLYLVSDIKVFDLSRREADVGIRYKKPTNPDLVGRRIGALASALYASRAYLAARGPVGEGEGHQLIGFPPELDASKEARALATRYPKARMAVRANTAGHQLSAARAGLGIALLDCLAGDADSTLVRVEPEPVHSDELWAIVHVDMHRSARVRVVVDFLGEICRDARALLEGSSRA